VREVEETPVLMKVKRRVRAPLWWVNASMGAVTTSDCEIWLGSARGPADRLAVRGRKTFGPGYKLADLGAFFSAFRFYFTKTSGQRHQLKTGDPGRAREGEARL